MYPVACWEHTEFAVDSPSDIWQKRSKYASLYLFKVSNTEIRAASIARFYLCCNLLNSQWKKSFVFAWDRCLNQY